MQSDSTTDKNNGQESEGAAINTEQGSSEQGAQAPAAVTQHLYYEVGNELLSKPNALSDVIQAMGYPATAVFCNSPSEADMVDVMLKKRAITTCKLIGHVPYQRVAQSLQQLKQKDLIVIVLTDISSRDIDMGIFDVVINYSIHEDPEIYLHRMSAHQSADNPATLISLVGPNDFTNFHYLKKVVDFKLNKAELPSKEELWRGESDRLIAGAVRAPKSSDARLAFLAEQVLASEHKAQIVEKLLDESLNILPALRNAGSRGEERQREQRDWDRRPEGEDDRGGDRWDRQRRGRGGDRDRRRNDDGRYPGNRRDDDYAEERPRSRNGEGQWEEGGGRRPDRRDLPPPRRDVRCYIGRGASQGMDEARFTGIVQECCPSAAGQLKRFSLREDYSFVDVPEELATEFLGKLSAVKVEDQELFCAKATVISAPREEGNEEGAPEPGEGPMEDGCCEESPSDVDQE